MAALVLTIGRAGAQTTVPRTLQPSGSVPTELRVESVAWWPTKGSADRKQYARSGACAKCHAEKFASQVATSMAHAATPASEADPLRTHYDLSFQLGPYVYELTTKDGNSVLSVTNGKDTAAMHLQWALGRDNFGQSYVYRQNGRYYEAQLSFYARLNGLDITTGHSRDTPQNIEAAAGGYTTLDTI